MKFIFLFFISIGFLISSYAQEKRLSIEMSYPFTIDNNFIGANYNGLIDVGMKYRFSLKDFVRFGASFNSGIYTNSKNESNNPSDIVVFALQPRLFAELNPTGALVPYVGFGYSFLIFNISDMDSINEMGLNLSLGVAYELSKSWFIQAQYDFVKIKVKKDIPDINYNSNVNILKVGFGYRI